MRETPKNPSEFQWLPPVARRSLVHSRGVRRRSLSNLRHPASNPNPTTTRMRRASQWLRQYSRLVQHFTLDIHCHRGGRAGIYLYRKTMFTSRHAEEAQ
jgi:hypothetical protein